MIFRIVTNEGCLGPGGAMQASREKIMIIQAENEECVRQKFYEDVENRMYGRQIRKVQQLVEK